MTQPDDWAKYVLGYNAVQNAGVAVTGSPGERILNIIGAKSIDDNPSNGSTDVTLGGGQDAVLTGANANVAITDTSSYIVKFTGLTAARTLTLPSAPGAGQRVTVSDADGTCTVANTISVLGNGNPVGSTIQTGFVLTNPFEAHVIEWNGTLWVHLSKTKLELPPRGLTLSLRADMGVWPSSGAVKQWYLQNPSLLNAWFACSGGATFNATGFNGKATLDFSDGTADPYQCGISAFEYMNVYVLPNAFTFAAVIEYTGAKDWSSGQICPQIINEAGPSNPHDTCGLSVGIDPGNSSNVIFSAYVSDSNGGSAAKYAQSASVPANVAHYVVATFGGGTISLYVDNLTVVQTTGVGDMTASALQQNLMIGSNSTSGNEALAAHVQSVHAWNVCLTADEVAQAQAWLKNAGGL